MISIVWSVTLVYGQSDEVPLSVLRQPASDQRTRSVRDPSTTCPMSEYFDEITMVCEYCSDLCGPRGLNPSPECLHEPNCLGFWNCSVQVNCDATCDSPQEKNGSGHVLRRGLADCHCQVDQNRGGVPCSGRNRTTCYKDIEEQCQQEIADRGHNRFTAGIMATVLTIIGLAVVLSLGFIIEKRFHVKERIENWYHMNFPPKPLPVSEGKDIEGIRRHGAVAIPLATHRVHNDDLDVIAHPSSVRRAPGDDHDRDAARPLHTYTEL